MKYLPAKHQDIYMYMYTYMYIEMCEYYNMEEDETLGEQTSVYY